MEDISNSYRDDLDKSADPVVIGAGAPGSIFGSEFVIDSYPYFDDERSPQKEGDWGDDSHRIRYGNNRYHVPKAKARAKAKARKQAQKAARRR